MVQIIWVGLIKAESGMRKEFVILKFTVMTIDICIVHHSVWHFHIHFFVWVSLKICYSLLRCPTKSPAATSASDGPVVRSCFSCQFTLTAQMLSTFLYTQGKCPQDKTWLSVWSICTVPGIQLAAIIVWRPGPCIFNFDLTAHCIVPSRV